jgi:hypothetical protein
MIRLCATLIGITLALGALPASAQTCDEFNPDGKLTTDGIPSTPYDYLEDYGICEGLYAKNSGMGPLEVVGLFEGDTLARFGEDDVLVVSAPRGGGSRVAVRAANEEKRYRMDAVIEPDGHVRWPVNRVLIPENILPDDLQIFGRLGGASGKLLVPVHVGTTPLDTPAPVTLQVVTDHDVKDVEAIVGKTCDGDGERVYESSSWHNAKVPFDIPLPADLHGEVCVKVEVRVPSNKDQITQDTQVHIWLGKE